MTPLDALSFQLYSARMLKPLESQFELLAGLGYDKVEPYAALFADPDRLRRLLDRHRMAAPTAHVGLDQLRADPREVANICRGLGIGTIFAPAPAPGERGQDAAGWRALGQELARIGKVVADEGLQFGWHNHHWEFGRGPDGRTFLEWMFAEAPNLLWEPDVAWIVRGGADPVAELVRRAGRVPAVHVKDIAPAGRALDEDGWADPGHGTLDWDALLAAMRTAGAKLFVVEHDRPNDVARFARRARETVSRWR